MPSEAGEKLREAAELIDEAAEATPEGDYDAETLAAYEKKFGEVPSLRGICRDIASTSRRVALLVDVNEGEK